MLGRDQAAVGAHPRGPAPGLVEQHLAGPQQAALDQAAERHARRLAPGRDRHRLAVGRDDRGDALARQRGVGRVALDADKAPAEPLRHRAGGAGAEERIEHHVARPGRRQQHAVQQRLGLLRRMRLLAVAAFQPLRPAAERDQPVAAHLDVFVERLHRLVVEGVARVAVSGAPQQRLVRVGEAPAAEIRHRVGLAPDDVVQDPEAQILEDRADAKDVVIAADDPERARRLQQPPAFAEPGAGEAVVLGETRRTCPSRPRPRRPGCCRAGAARRQAADCRADRRRRDRP